MLDEELLSQPIRQQLLEAQREETSFLLGRTEARVRALEQLLAEQRRNETAQLIADTEMAALGRAGNNEVVRELVDRNQKLSTELEFLIDAIEQASTDTIAATELKNRILQHFETAQHRMEIVGLNQALGRVLHEQRRDLPSQRDYRRKAQNRHQALVESGLRDIQYDAEWAELQNRAAYLDELLAEISELEMDTVRESLGELVDARRTLMQKTLSANTTYIRVLGEQDFEEQQLLSSADEFDTFLAKRLMWVRSANVVGLNSSQVLLQEISAFLAPDDWIDAMGALIERLFAAPVLGLVLLISVILFWQTGAIKNAVRASGRNVGNALTDSYRATVTAVGLSFLLVIPWVLIISVSGWELSRAIYTTDGSRAIGAGLVAAGTLLMFVLSARALCLDGGIAQAHFRWPAKFVEGIRRGLNRLLLTFAIPGFVLVVTVEQHAANMGGELSRLMFIVATMALTVFLIKLLKPGTGLFDDLTRRRDAGAKLSIVWLLFGAGIPAIMIVAAFAGFLYSARSLMQVLIDTLWLLLGLIFAHEMISRWLVVLRQRLLHQARLSEWEAARKQDEGSGESEELPPPADEPMVDVASLDVDARNLLNMSLVIALIIGLGAIWSPVLPALTILDNVTLWTYHEGPAGAETLVRVTLANLGMLLIILLATIFATRSIPSLLEALLRQQSSITAGSRLAFATLARYAIVLAGIVFIADSIGFKWSQIQWLIAALGVGIGFGLQEIIANFISGLIILMERPIRVGDVVTIGDVSGRVSRIQIRATTITNWDRQELLVPNKEFITGRVLNWTLSDDVVRVVATVGVSYGSDMDKAMTLVREAADENEYVRQTPQPLVTFDEFGDNSLNVTLGCFIDSPAHRREAKSALNLSIKEKLHNAGIVVAFPQRDIHLDTSGPLDIRIQNNEDSQ
jgi:potassium efflux system protein